MCATSKHTCKTDSTHIQRKRNRYSVCDSDDLAFLSFFSPLLIAKQYNAKYLCHIHILKGAHLQKYHSMGISESQWHFLLLLVLYWKINLMELVNFKVCRISLHIYQHTKQLSSIVNCRKITAEIYQLYALQNSSLKIPHSFDQIPGKYALMHWQSGIIMLWSF